MSTLARRCGGTADWMGAEVRCTAGRDELRIGKIGREPRAPWPWAHETVVTRNRLRFGAAPDHALTTARGMRLPGNLSGGMN